jgi:hypothetical protein
MIGWVVVAALALIVVGGVVVACVGDDEDY